MYSVFSPANTRFHITIDLIIYQNVHHDFWSSKLCLYDYEGFFWLLWLHQICFISFSYKYNHLTLFVQVFDEDNLAQDKKLGVAKLPLIDLEPEITKEYDLRLLPSLDMLKVKDKKDRGTVTLRVRYFINFLTFLKWSNSLWHPFLFFSFIFLLHF